MGYKDRCVRWRKSERRVKIILIKSTALQRGIPAGPCFRFFTVCGAAFGRAQGLAWCSAANLASFDLFQGNPIVLSFFSLSAVRPSTGRKAWCGKANLASFDLFQGNPIVLLLFSLSAGRPSTGRKAWCGKANLAKLGPVPGKSDGAFVFLPSAGRPSAGRRGWSG